MKNPIYPCIWFDGNAKEAALLYSSAFKNTKIIDDTPMVVNFELEGQKIMCLNGGPMFKPNPAISFFVVCETIDELDFAWEKLATNSSVMMPLDKYAWSEKYGWLNDKFGVSWQLFLGKQADFGQKLVPNLLFTGELSGKTNQAIEHYTGIFGNSSLRIIEKYKEGDNDVIGNIKHAQFMLNNQLFIAMDSSINQHYVFTEGNSLVVECDTQDEIDYCWRRLTEGGVESLCGWLKDKFGVSWQIIPSILSELMKTPEKSERVIQAFLKMKKFDIEKLKQA